MNASPILAFSYSCMLHIERPISGLMITNISKTSVFALHSLKSKPAWPNWETSIDRCAGLPLKKGNKYNDKSKLQCHNNALSKGHQQGNWVLMKQWNRRGEHLFGIIKCKYKQPVLNGAPRCIAHCQGPPRLSKIEYTICLSGASPLVSGTDGTVLAVPLSFP